MFQMPIFNIHTPNEIIENRLAMVHERNQCVKVDLILSKYKTTRPTFYKFYNRFKEFGKIGLQDISKAPKKHGTKTSVEDENMVEDIFVQHPYFSSYELNQLIPLNPRTIQRILKRKNLKKVYKPKAEKKKLLEKLKQELRRKGTPKKYLRKS